MLPVRVSEKSSAERVDRTDTHVETFTAVIIKDENVFERPGLVEVEFPVDVDRLRAFVKETLPPSPSPLIELQKKGDADFRIAPIEFNVQTRGALSRVPGVFAVSIWHKRIPVDELLVAFCTEASDCKGAKIVAAGLSGIDSARTALEGKSAFPAAAIHLLRFKNGVVGALRDHTAPEPEYLSWILDNSVLQQCSRRLAMS